jgi:acyl-CoA reductase-like NAD-dependent aldehyde dehydrogenase
MSDIAIKSLLTKLGIKSLNESVCTGTQWITPIGSEVHEIKSPVDGNLIASVTYATTTEYERVTKVAHSAFEYWQNVPALVSYEMGKSLQEGLGEVQEMIDICDFAVGVSRQLYGLTMHSERENHRMYEQWHPLGIVGIISAFNFPVAVWNWNATGSTRMGKRVGQLVGARLGKCILELGGNNALIISDEANLSNALKAAVFGAVGTAGQRCTTTRRLIIHDSIYEKFKSQLVKIYEQLKIGNPLDQTNHVGPLIDQQAVDFYSAAIQEAQNEGGRVLFGNKVLTGKGYESGCYVLPTLIEAQNHYRIVQEETFAPITYFGRYPPKGAGRAFRSYLFVRTSQKG